MTFDEIKLNGKYEIIESFDSRRMVAGTKVTVWEKRTHDEPMVYCYGENGGSAYINASNLKEISDELEVKESEC